MRFLADMGISPNTVAFLRAQGHDAVHLLEVELERLTDSAILEKALQEERILLTHDLDFGELLAASKAQLPSVIIFRLQNMRPARVNSTLAAVLAEHADVLTAGVVISVTEGRLRVRRLPIEG